MPYRRYTKKRPAYRKKTTYRKKTWKRKSSYRKKKPATLFRTTRRNAYNAYRLTVGQKANRLLNKIKN